MDDLRKMVAQKYVQDDDCMIVSFQRSASSDSVQVIEGDNILFYTIKFYIL